MCKIVYHASLNILFYLDYNRIKEDCISCTYTKNNCLTYGTEQIKTKVLHSKWLAKKLRKPVLSDKSLTSTFKKSKIYCMGVMRSTKFAEAILLYDLNVQ